MKISSDEGWAAVRQAAPNITYVPWTSETSRHRRRETICLPVSVLSPPTRRLFTETCYSVRRNAVKCRRHRARDNLSDLRSQRPLGSPTSVHSAPALPYRLSQQLTRLDGDRLDSVPWIMNKCLSYTIFCTLESLVHQCDIAYIDGMISVDRQPTTNTHATATITTTPAK